MYDREVVEGEIISPQERISRLKQELADLEGGDDNGLLGNLNPGKLKSMFNLTDKQSENVKAAVIGAGAGLSNRYLSKYCGDELSSVVGAFLGAYVAKKMFGSGK